VQAAYSKHLIKTYGNVPSIIENQQQQLSFCKLPLDAVEGWGMSDEFRVDTENSLVVLLNEWWHSQPEDMQTEDCKKRLSSLVRPTGLSYGYLLSALEMLDWFIAPFLKYKLATLVSTTAESTLYQINQPKMVIQIRNRGYSPKDVMLHWSLSEKEILEAVGCKTDGIVHGPTAYGTGHIWSLYFRGSLHNAEGVSDGNKVLKLSLGLRLSTVGKMPEGIPATARVDSYYKPWRQTDQYTLFEDCEGWCVDATLGCTTVQDALETYLTDVELKIKVRIRSTQ
jgi:hypothetical protein